ncbi:MAG TPA: hypothetical protein VFO60_05880, partial [Candidatus Dormibacteraeota bacterium]|nr:hypothetical protein [Candidatus Dormibacteraeota bacterium]
RDHASVPSTLRALFAPEGRFLTHRDEWSPPFHGLASLEAPRRDLPDLSGHVAAPPAPPAGGTPPPGALPVPAYYESYAALARNVDSHLKHVREPEAAPPLAASQAERAAQVSAIFASAAARHRRERAGREQAPSSA